MRVFSKLAVALSVLFSVCSVSFAHENRHFAKHHRDELAVRAASDMSLWKRFDNARFTFYAVGLGACGQVNQPGDFVRFQCLFHLIGCTHSSDRLSPSTQRLDALNPFLRRSILMESVHCSNTAPAGPVSRRLRSRSTARQRKHKLWMRFVFLAFEASFATHQWSSVPDVPTLALISPKAYSSSLLTWGLVSCTGRGSSVLARLLHRPRPSPRRLGKHPRPPSLPPRGHRQRRHLARPRPPAPARAHLLRHRTVLLSRPLRQAALRFLLAPLSMSLMKHC